jgi:hypothetical protein
VKPADIRDFHRANYHLANMGMIASLSQRLARSTRLRSAMDARACARPSRSNPQLPVKSEKDLPPPQAGAGRRHPPRRVSAP